MLHAVCDGQGRPLILLLSEGQMSDYKGAALMLPALPKAKELLGDKGYDANWFRKALAKRGIAACIPSKANRKKSIEYDRTLYVSATRSRIYSVGSRIGDAFTHGTTDALTHSCQLYVSQQPSSFGYDQ